jgi:hypothetical protein
MFGVSRQQTSPVLDLYRDGAVEVRPLPWR